MDERPLDEQETDFVTSVKKYANSLTAYMKSPEVQAQELMNINDKVMEFFRLVNSASAVKLDGQDLTKLYSMVESFHKTATKKYRKVREKVAMTDSGKGGTNLKAIEIMAERVESAAKQAEFTLKNVKRSESENQNQALLKDIKEYDAKVREILGAELYASYKSERQAGEINFDASIRLTISSRNLLATDNLIVVAFNDTESKHRLAVANIGGYTKLDDGRSVCGVLVTCSRCAEVLELVLEDDRLKELRGGVKNILRHEIGHAKLQNVSREKNGRGRKAKLENSETLAEVRALALAEVEGGRQAAVRGFASALAISTYVQEENLETVLNKRLSHFQDEIHLKDSGISREEYLLGRMSFREEVLKLAEQDFQKLKKIIG
ncbi:MAG: hypothetical protein KGI04_04865 [Candidatus Micrarchaeota archaeon]|nr:hypothetical protein [Candidatus Micrarchaeota archaeon]